jgi:hypothetical protein
MNPQSCSSSSADHNSIWRPLMMDLQKLCFLLSLQHRPSYSTHILGAETSSLSRMEQGRGTGESAEEEDEQGRECANKRILGNQNFA